MSKWIIAFVLVLCFFAFLGNCSVTATLNQKVDLIAEQIKNLQKPFWEKLGGK